MVRWYPIFQRSDQEKLVPTYHLFAARIDTYPAKRNQNDCASCLTASEKRKAVKVRSTLPAEHLMYLSSAQRFNYKRTTRTELFIIWVYDMRKSSQKCISFFAFNSKGTIRAVPCGKWSCEVCRKKNAQMWGWRAQIHIDNATHTYWCWTFTLGSKYKTRKQGYESLKRLWDNLRTVIRRNYSKSPSGATIKWTYLAFVEEQPKKRKMPHFHILTNIPSPYRIKDWAVFLGFGFEAYEDEVVGKQAARYVSKYVSKGGTDMPRGFRRVRSSQNWAKLPPFIGDRLIVKRNSESITDYLLRVADTTDTEIQDLWDRWRVAHEID